jgi:hypothetical protein
MDWFDIIWAMHLSLWNGAIIGLAGICGGVFAWLVSMRRLDLRRRLADRELAAMARLEESIAKRRRRCDQRHAGLRRRADVVMGRAAEDSEQPG